MVHLREPRAPRLVHADDYNVAPSALAFEHCQELSRPKEREDSLELLPEWTKPGLVAAAVEVLGEDGMPLPVAISATGSLAFWTGSLPRRRSQRQVSSNRPTPNMSVAAMWPALKSRARAPFAVSVQTGGSGSSYLSSSPTFPFVGSFMRHETGVLAAAHARRSFSSFDANCTPSSRTVRSPRGRLTLSRFVGEPQRATASPYTSPVSPAKSALPARRRRHSPPTPPGPSSSGRAPGTARS